MSEVDEIYFKGKNNCLPRTSRTEASKGNGTMRRIGIAERPAFAGVSEPEQDASGQDCMTPVHSLGNKAIHDCHCRVQVLLYTLMRDATPTGVIAEIVQNIATDHRQSSVPVFTNKELAAMADRYTDKLLSGI